MALPDSPSGVYICSNCGNSTTHVKGRPFAPCAGCGCNNCWEPATCKR